MMIYFIQAADGTGLIKIGYSASPKRRLKSIQLMSPMPLKILKTIKGDKKTESYIHKQFGGLRRHGEWFESSPILLEAIDNPDAFIIPAPKIIIPAPKIIASGDGIDLVSRIAEIANLRKIGPSILAREAFISWQTAQRLWDGETKRIKFYTLAQLCRVLECQPGDLFQVNLNNGGGHNE